MLIMSVHFRLHKGRSGLAQRLLHTQQVMSDVFTHKAVNIFQVITPGRCNYNLSNSIFVIV